MSVPEFHIRTATAADLPAITSALAWAIDWRFECRENTEVLIEATGHTYLLENWGRERDTAVIAEMAHSPVGSAWFRYWTDEQHSYGYVAPDCPEIGIGVDPRYRGMGIGRALLSTLIDVAVSDGIGRLSLSVEFENPAVRLYELHGFVKSGVVDASWTMVRELELASDPTTAEGIL